MNVYKITGNDRQEGAIGINENFVEIVAADTAKAAYDKAKQRRYKADREHVLVVRVYVDHNNEWAEVDPAAYW